MRIPARSETIRAVQKVLLVHGLQQHRDRPLEHLVLKGWDAKRAALPVAFRNVHAPHWRRPVVTGLRQLQQLREIALELLRVLFGGLPILSRRATFPGTTIG